MGAKGDRYKARTGCWWKVDQAKMRYFGHVVRGNSLEKAMLQGMVFGKRSQGRQKTRWIDGTTSHIIDRDEHQKGDKTGGKEERRAGARTTRHGRSAATSN